MAEEVIPHEREAHRAAMTGIRNGSREASEADIPDPQLSSWPYSRGKRMFDVTAVLLFSPLLLPLLVFVTAAVWISSGMPVIFRQLRMGRGGVPFAIYKFRTMQTSKAGSGSGIAIESARRITWMGYLLRRLKLDELPQLVNVLIGDMSLVGPRPKVPEQQPYPLPCRPGLTGVATLVFAREEAMLQAVPPDELNEYFHKKILPAKRALDAEYLRSATIWSDIQILVNTVVGRWGSCNRTVSCPHDGEHPMNVTMQSPSVSQ
ncbi:MAG TPA: sugar transferase [Terracidiphilus sp.]|nr:sugar transferase [Terracidiphilus sp.]